MRALLILVLVGATASADQVVPLPKPVDHPPSEQARTESWKLFTGCVIDQEGCLASWVRAATLDPSSIEVRVQLADYYYRKGDKAAALAVMDQLKASACQECLRALVKVRLRAWEHDVKFSDQVTKGLHGRKTKYSAAAATVISALVTGDWAQLKPFVSKKGVRWDPDAGVLSENAIKDILDRVGNTRASIRASGLTTCEDDCCYEIWDTLGGDEPMYLEGLCFGPGPVLLETSWDSLR